jgi:hypothetical protein
MESFRISTDLGGSKGDVLVIPDDCDNKSVFHIVKDSAECCKLIYTEAKQWQVEGDLILSDDEIEELSSKIEDHYF